MNEKNILKSCELVKKDSEQIINNVLNGKFNEKDLVNLLFNMNKRIVDTIDLMKQNNMMNDEFQADIDILRENQTIFTSLIRGVSKDKLTKNQIINFLLKKLTKTLGNDVSETNSVVEESSIISLDEPKEERKLEDEVAFSVPETNSVVEEPSIISLDEPKEEIELGYLEELLLRNGIEDVPETNSVVEESSIISLDEPKEEIFFDEEAFFDMNVYEQMEYLEILCENILEYKSDDIVEVEGYRVAAKYAESFRKYLALYNNIRIKSKNKNLDILALAQGLGILKDENSDISSELDLTDKSLKEQKKDIIKDIQFLADSACYVEEMEDKIKELIDKYRAIETREKYFTEKALKKLFVNQGFTKEEAEYLASVSYKPENLQENKDVSDEEKTNIFRRIKKSLTTHIHNYYYGRNFEINWDLVNGKSLEEQILYFSELMDNILDTAENYPSNLMMVIPKEGNSENKKFIVNKEDVEVFKQCYNKYIDLEDKLSKEEQDLDESEERDLTIYFNKYDIRRLKDEIKVLKVKIQEEKINNPEDHDAINILQEQLEEYKEKLNELLVENSEILGKKGNKFKANINDIYNKVSRALKSMPSKASEYISKIKSIRKPKNKIKMSENIKKKAAAIAVVIAGTAAISISAVNSDGKSINESKISYETNTDDVNLNAGVSKDIVDALAQNPNNYKFETNLFDNNQATNDINYQPFKDILGEKDSENVSNLFTFGTNNVKEDINIDNTQKPKSNLTSQESTMINQTDKTNKPKSNLTSQETANVKSKTSDKQAKTVEEKAEEIGSKVYDVSYNNNNSNKYGNINDLNLEETFTIDNDAKIYKDEYSAAAGVNGLHPYFASDSNHIVTALVYNYNGSMVVLDVNDPLFENKKVALENNGAVLEAVRSQNEASYDVEGFYNIDDINMGGRTR